MTPDQLKQWLLAHADDISGFTDYEIEIISDAELHSDLGESWFRDEGWNEPGYRFVHLGQDGTGGLVTLWFRPDSDTPPPVVFFGSEGGCGVVAASPEAWAKVLAHGPMLVEFAEVDTETSAMSLEENWYLADDAAPEHRAEAQARLQAYRTATVERFGSLEPFDDLAAVDASDQVELKTWVEGVLERTFARDDEVEREAAVAKHVGARRKAEAYATSCSDEMPEDARQRRDGSKFRGRCPACGENDELRLTRYEDLNFGICFDCYFSSAW